MSDNGWLLGCLIAIGLWATEAPAQDAEEKNGDSYEKLARPLRLAPKERIEISKARLGDVLRMLAAEAGISFVSNLDNRDASSLISITFEGSPFSALEAIAKDHDIELIVKDGVWSVIYSASGKVRTVTYVHTYSSVNTTENQKQWPDYVDRLFRPHDRPHDPYFSAPMHPIVEIDFSLVQIEIGHDEILMGPQKDGPVTKIILTNEEKAQLKALLTLPNTLTISQRKLALQPYRKVLVDCLSSEVVDGVRTNPPDPNYKPGTGINLPMYPALSNIEVILPRGTQVALECNTSDDVEAVLRIDTTQAGLRKGPEKNPTIDMLFAATQHRAIVKAPIGKTIVIGSFENYRSRTDIAFKKKTPRKKTLLMIRPTKVVGLDWPKSFNSLEEIGR